MDTLYTLGYERRTLDEYLALLRDVGVTVLLDVRETPWSYKPGFSKAPLASALSAVGITYIHADFAGNPKWVRETARDHADCLIAYEKYIDVVGDVIPTLDRVLSDLFAAGQRVCLTCFERHPGDCHRSILTARWAVRPGRRVEHLACQGLPRRAPELDALVLAL